MILDVNQHGRVSIPHRGLDLVAVGLGRVGTLRSAAVVAPSRRYSSSGPSRNT
jgi:hypothetical protein